VEFVAIVERRLLNWHVCIPVLVSGASVPDLDDVESCATAVVTAATGLVPDDVQISVHRAVQSDTVVRISPMDVEIRHSDGTWRVAQHIGVVRPRDGSWKPLVRYVADGATWERAVHVSRFRRPTPDVAAVS
jgi:hypothetical protein